MEIESLLQDLNNQHKAKSALIQLQKLVKINNTLLCDLLSAKTNSNWHVITISGHEYNKPYNRYILRHGVAFINENHPDFQNVRFPKTDNTPLKPSSFKYIKPSKDLELTHNDSINTDENLIICNYGTAMSSAEKYLYIDKAREHNWLLDLLSYKGYDIQPTTNFTKFNNPEQIEFVLSTIEEYFLGLLHKQNAEENELCK